MEDEIRVPQENGEVNQTHHPPPPAAAQAPPQEEAPVPPAPVPLLSLMNTIRQLLQDPHEVALGRAQLMIQSHNDGFKWLTKGVHDMLNRSTEYMFMCSEMSRGCPVTRKITVTNGYSNNGVHNHFPYQPPPQPQEQEEDEEDFLPPSPSNDPGLVNAPIPVRLRVAKVLLSQKDSMKWIWTGTIERPIYTIEYTFVCSEHTCSVTRKLTVTKPIQQQW